MSASRHQRRPFLDSEQDLVDRSVRPAAVVNVNRAVRDQRKREAEESNAHIEELTCRPNQFA